MPRFLIPIDGSDSALRAVRHVINLARELRERPDVVLLNVQPPVPVKDLMLEGRPSEIHRLEAPLQERGAALLEPPAVSLKAAGIPVQQVVEIGEPAPSITRTAASHHCDLILMGARGLTAIDSVILGSVSTRVIHFSKVPVVVVK
ncbi:MAG: universal stress protein [Betaproteobacteria bacterium]|nr:universal stress protein [Betaproteobacteria bacterium]